MEINEDGTNASLCMLIDNHLIEWDGNATYNIYFIGGHGLHKVHEFFDDLNIYKIKQLRKNMTEIFESFWYGDD